MLTWLVIAGPVTYGDLQETASHPAYSGYIMLPIVLVHEDETAPIAHSRCHRDIQRADTIG